MPVIRRIVTISGSAVAEPKNLEARIGTPIEKLIDACGGFKEAPNKLLAGGPMMGNAQFSLDAPVVKGTNASSPSQAMRTSASRTPSASAAASASTPARCTSCRST